MPKVFLTGALLRSLKPTDAQVDYFDTKISGPSNRVSAGGTKSFFYHYRMGPLSRRMTIGRCPVVKLAEARKIANDAASQVAKGFDPQNERLKTREMHVNILFPMVVEEFLENHAKRNTRSWKEPKRILKKEFARRWRKLPLDQITRHTISSVLDEIYRSNGPSAANHAFSSIRGFFNWCVERGHLLHSPCAGMKAPSKAVERERVLNDSELADVYEAAGLMGYPFGHLVKLLTLTGQRRNEVSGLQWDHLDVAKGAWTQPPRSNKSGRLHTVPLNAQSSEILTAVPRIHDALVFPARGKDRPISGFSKWKRELDQHAQGAAFFRRHVPSPCNRRSNIGTIGY